MAKQIGKYGILRTLGQGAMGEVYLAHDPAIGREVAIKTILPSAAKGEDAEGRFRREAAAAGRLSHPNLVTVFDFDKDQEVFFLVMEYVKGDDLEDLIRQRALSSSQYLEVLAQVCDGLAHAHRNGIIHRDIKPANIRVMREGKQLQAKVMDFGIARMADSNLTATGIVMGTVNYMAPEYIRDGHATAQSDLFAVGVMLYECLTGRKPFAGDNTTTVLFKIVSDTPQPIELEATRGISPSIRDVLDRALAKDPGARFQAAEDLAKALRACKDPTFSGHLDEIEATSLLARPGLPEAKPAGTGASVSPGASASTGAPAPTLAERRPEGGATAGVAQPLAARPRRSALLIAGAVVLLGAGGAWLALRPRPAPVRATLAEAPAVPAPAPVPSAPVPEPSPAPAVLPAPARPKEAAKETPQVAPRVAPAARPAVPLPEPKPADPPAEDPLKNIGRLIESDPRQAAALLRPLVQARPGAVDLQGNYLAALYRSRNGADFEHALTRASNSGVSVRGMLAVPAFRAAMADESRLQKAKPPMGVLAPEVMAKVVEGL